MTVHVFKTAKGQVLVGGLGPWVAMVSPNERQRSKEVRQAAERVNSKHAVEHARMDGASFVAVLPPNAPTGAQRGAAAAPLFAELFPKEHVIYVEQMRDGQYWIVSAVAGDLDPRTDLIMSANEAVTEIDHLLTEATGFAPRVLLNVVDEPQSGMLSRADRQNATMAAMLDAVKVAATYKVKQVSGVTPGAIVATVSVLALLIVGAGGWWWWQDNEKQKKFAAEALAAQEALALQKQIENEVELRIVKAVAESLQTDTATPTPDALVAACLKVVDWVGPGVAGWRVERITCDTTTGGYAMVALQPANLVAGWPGTTESLNAFAARHQLNATYDPQSGAGSLTVPLTGVAMRPPLRYAQLPRLMEINDRLPTRMQLERQANSQLSLQMTAAVPVALRYRDPTNEAATQATGGQVAMLPVPDERAYRRGTVALGSNGLWQLERLGIDWPYWSIKKLEIVARERGEYTWQMEAMYVAANS